MVQVTVVTPLLNATLLRDKLTTPDLDYDRDFSAAYELGHRARSESKEGTQFEDMEGSLQQKWEELKAESRLKWEHAKQAIKDAWDDM